jgi:hypothetical protein
MSAGENVMNEVLTQALYKEFDQLYADHKKPAQESAMFWGFECGDGWYPLLRSLSRELEDYARLNPEFHVQATQVKSKFGELRFHLAESSASTDAMVERARQLASRTCEMTGTPGALCVRRPAPHRRAEYKVLCEQKAAELGFVKTSTGSLT